VKHMLHKLSRSEGVFAHRDMRLVVPARALSFLGDSVTFVVLLLKVSEDGQPIRLTVLLAAFSLPLFVMTPIAGRIVDEFDSRYVLVAAGTVQAGASLAMALSPTFIGLVSAMLVLQTAESITAPAWSALVPRIVGEQLIGKAVGIQQSLAGLTGLAGAAIGGILYDRIGFTRTVLIDTVTFAALVLVAAGVRTRRGRRYDARAQGSGLAEIDASAVRAEGGIAIVRADAVLRVVIPALCLFVLGIESINVVEVFLVRGDLGGSATDYGLISAAWMLGQAIGPMLAARVADDRGRISVTAGSAVAIGLLVALIGLSPTLWPIYPLYATAGLGAGALNGCLSTLVVTRSAEAVRGRVIAVLVGATRGCSAVGMVLGGVLGELLGARTTFVICGALSGLVALLVLRALGSARPSVSPMPIAAATMEA
jgi:MFS family permease